LSRLLTVVLCCSGFSVAAGPLSLAQIFSEVDTISVISASGFPGDTVMVPFDLVNTFHVGGFEMRTVYDHASFRPLSMSLTSRSQQFELFGVNFADSGIVQCFATSWHPENAIIPGSGAIINLDLAIRPEAVPGYYFIRFENADSMSQDNALTNTIGDSLVIPIFVERQIEVRLLDNIGPEDRLPTAFGLAQNYPNPFNAQTRISFFQEQPGPVELSIFNLLGQVVATPFSGWAPAGESVVGWDGKDDTGSDVVSGPYFYRFVSSGGEAVTRKMTLLK